MVSLRQLRELLPRTEITPTLEDWTDYLNKHYQWGGRLRKYTGPITPAMLERALSGYGIIKPKKQPKTKPQLGE